MSAPGDSAAAGAPDARSRRAELQVKICGITRAEDARRALAAGADYLGLVFAGSRRRLTLEEARRLAGETGEAPWVGVFVDAAADQVLRAAHAVGLRAVQLHGAEDVATICELREAGLEVWKAVGVDVPADWAEVEDGLAGLEGAVDLVLLDRRSEGAMGGGGAPFDWEGFPVSLPLARTRLGLSGGLGPHNLARALARVPADLVDASSALETAPGIKDPRRVREFVRAAREAGSRALAAPRAGRPARRAP